MPTMNIPSVETSLNAMMADLYGDQPGDDIWLLAGQSNGSGRLPMDELVDVTNPRVFQYGSYEADTATLNKRVLGSDPLKMPDSKAVGNTGPGSWFGRTKAMMTPQGRNIVLVPYCAGGTTLLTGTPLWGPGGSLREGAISQANAIIAQSKALYPSSKFRGIIWSQGEGDWAQTQSAYVAAAKDLFSEFRTRITGASRCVIIIGGMVPEAVATRNGYADIDAAHKQLASEVRDCVYVPGISSYTNDNLHYNAGHGARILGSALARYSLVAEGFETPSVPENLIPVSIKGAAETDVTLTAVTGVWEGYPKEYKHQWYRDGVAISGATTAIYTTTGADESSVITVTETAVTSDSSVTITSAATAPITVRVPLSTYTFDSDVVTQQASYTTPLSTYKLQVEDSGISGWSGRYARTSMTTSSDTDSHQFDDLVSATPDQVVTWDRAQTSSGARDMMMLRAQQAFYGTGVIPQGYGFMTSASNTSLRIYKFGATIQTLANVAYTMPSSAKFRATVSGAATTTLNFEYSTDGGTTWTSIGAITDTVSPFTTTDRPISYVTGFSAPTPGSAFIDNVKLG